MVTARVLFATPELPKILLFYGCAIVGAFESHPLLSVKALTLHETRARSRAFLFPC